MQDPRYKHESLNKMNNGVMILMMKVTNIYKHDIVDTVAYFQSNGLP